MRFTIPVIALAAAISAYQSITQISDGQLQAPPAPTPSGRPAPAAPPNAPLGPMPLAPVNPPPTEPRPPLHLLPKPGASDAPPPPAPSGPPTPPYPLLDMSAALSNLRSRLAHNPTPGFPIKPPPESQHNTPGTVLACIITCYRTWSGDDPTFICDVLSSPLKECRNFSAALTEKVVAVRPDMGRIFLLYEERDCGGQAEWVKWPGVRNLRGRVG